ALLGVLRHGDAFEFAACGSCELRCTFGRHFAFGFSEDEADCVCARGDRSFNRCFRRHAADLDPHGAARFLQPRPARAVRPPLSMALARARGSGAVINALPTSANSYPAAATRPASSAVPTPLSATRGTDVGSEEASDSSRPGTTSRV